MTTEPFVVHYGRGDHEGICIIELDQPGRPVVVLDRDLIERLDATLDRLPEDAKGLVLASASERSFVAGADLRSITLLDDADLHGYLEYGAKVFGRISKLGFPTSAAINGAALGGGLELAMHCDGLIGAPSPGGKPYPVGLPEAGLSICPGWGGTQMLPARMDPAEAIRITASGTPMKYDEAVAAGLFDLTCDDPADLRRVAAAWVADRAGALERDGAPSVWIGRGERAAAVGDALERVRDELPQTEAARAVASCVETGLRDGWPAGLKAERGALVRLRHTVEAESAIAAFFAKSKR